MPVVALGATAAGLGFLLLAALLALTMYRRRMKLRQPDVVLGRPTPVEMRAGGQPSTTTAAYGTKEAGAEDGAAAEEEEEPAWLREAGEVVQESSKSEPFL